MPKYHIDFHTIIDAPSLTDAFEIGESLKAYLLEVNETRVEDSDPQVEEVTYEVKPLRGERDDTETL